MDPAPLLKEVHTSDESASDGSESEDETPKAAAKKTKAKKTHFEELLLNSDVLKVGRLPCLACSTENSYTSHTLPLQCPVLHTSTCLV